MTLPDHDIFLVVPGLRRRFLQREATLPLAPGGAGVRLFYRAETDVLLLQLRLDGTRDAQGGLAEWEERANHVGATVLDPDRLPEHDRRSFYEDHLALYQQRWIDLLPVDEVAQKLHTLLPSSDPRAASPSQRELHPVEVRFRRGDTWLLGRARSLTREGVYVTAGTPPRQGEIVDLQLAILGHTSLLQGSVVHVTSRHATTANGTAGFGVRFLRSGNADEHQALDEVLRRALSADDPVLPAPPRRRDVRYPVRWPVWVGSAAGPLRLCALDLSDRGMFLAHVGTPPGSPVAVSLPGDDGRGPIRATARVAREISAPVARSRKVARGFGLELLQFVTSDEARFRTLVSRIAERTDRCVVVGAAPGRVTELTTVLAAAGYSASGTTDTSTLLAKAASATSSDLMLLCPSLEVPGGPTVRNLQQALAGKKIRTVWMKPTQPPAEARFLADRALL